MEALHAAMTFNDGVRRLIENVECRRIVSEADRHAVYGLRYAAYLREGAIDPNPAQRIEDRFDHKANNQTFGFYIDGRLASTIRLGFASAAVVDVPALATFRDVLQPILHAGQTLIDPTRFVLDEAHARAYPKLAYVTLRMAWMVSDHLKVDHTLASVRTEHQAFYRRFFGHALLCPARPYPSLAKPLSLMILDCRKSRARGLARYPFLHSTRAEFDALWRPLSGAEPVRAGHALDQIVAHAPTSLG